MLPIFIPWFFLSVHCPLFFRKWKTYDKWEDNLNLINRILIMDLLILMFTTYIILGVLLIISNGYFAYTLIRQWTLLQRYCILITQVMVFCKLTWPHFLLQTAIFPWKPDIPSNFAIQQALDELAVGSEIGKPLFSRLVHSPRW